MKATTEDVSEVSATAASADSKLLRAIQAGDRSAFRTLYLRHVRSVSRYSYSIVRNLSEAEEATQDTWIALWDGRHKVQIHGDSLLPWLLTTARHKSLKRLRAARRAASVELSDGSGSHTQQTPEDTFISREIQAQLALTVSGLSPVDRDIYTLCIVQGRSYAAAGAELGLGRGAIRNRLFRLRRLLRKSVTMKEILQ